tara:strand:+ start:338 stop:1153 length:816 start_codon:yes stop_codon:yes gene_type:complete
MFYQKEKFIKKFIDIINLVNKKIIDIYYQDNLFIEYKNDKSPLTIADKEANKIICEFIEKLINDLDESNELSGYKKKDFVIISEESKNIEYKYRKDKIWAWLVDPIDGTKEFIKRNGQFTVNIGLTFNGNPIFGIVSIPVTSEIYYGIKGIGSFKILKNVKTKLKVKKKNLDNLDNIKIVASSSHINEETNEFIKKYNNPEIVNVGSSIKLLWVAENKADIYPRFGLTSEWDTCAAHSVVKYANGNVINSSSLKELEYNKENILNPFFLVF